MHQKKIHALPALLILLVSQGLAAQGFQTLFPGLEGQELVDSVSKNFRPATVLDYANARDTLYAKVLAIDDDSLRCIYSGHTLWLDPTQDPTQYVFQNGGPNGMNTEHAYPQSKGASTGNARSDMHHLYPARIPVNEARASVPYADIPDELTQKWFILNQVLTSIPAVNRDGYTESRTDAFEPRESVKGDVARAIFYFYTMYRAQANAADPNFFNLQRNTLCLWAQQDPADSSELVKTWRIAPYQDGKPNPFVVDCTLASRCWCPEFPPNCLVSTDAPPAPFEGALTVWPNPASERLHYRLETETQTTAVLIDLMGRTVMTQESTNGAGFFQIKNIPTGVYVLEITWRDKDFGFVRKRRSVVVE